MNSHQRRQAPVTMGRLVFATAVAAAVLLTVVVYRSTAATSERPATAGSGETQAAPNIDWDHPLVPIHPVSTDQQAASMLSVAPVVPRSLGQAVARYASSPNLHSATAIAWVYQHPQFGRFFVIESVSTWTQAQLQALANCDPKAGCEGQWSLVTVRGGITALQITGGPTTGLIWLEHGITFDVVGPVDSFTVADAIAVASSV